LGIARQCPSHPDRRREADRQRRDLDLGYDRNLLSGVSRHPGDHNRAAGGAARHHENVVERRVLKETQRRVRDAGVTGIRQHAVDLFPRPRGKHGRDLHGYALVRAAVAWCTDRPVIAHDEIMAQTEQRSRETPGFMRLGEWQAEVERRLQISE
jgi:hypothetical protein